MTKTHEQNPKKTNKMRKIFATHIRAKGYFPWYINQLALQPTNKIPLMR